jgi:putative ABC transport system substrate-binding protein
MPARRIGATLGVATLLAALGCLPAAAQTAGKVYRIGYLSSGSAAQAAHSREAFAQGLRDLGWIEGRNIVIEYRFAEGRFDRLPELAAELARLGVDVIAASPTPPAVAAKKATSTIPIVVMNVGDPVAIGLVASLARPGGNVTGVTYRFGNELIGKQLELLKQVLPGIRRVAFLTNRANPAHALAKDGARAMAGSLGVEPHFVEAGAAGEIDTAVQAAAKANAGALLVVPDSLFVLERERLVKLTSAHRLPSIYGAREHTEAGGLMSYGPSLAATSRRGASYVDRILKGARPGDLPMEQPATVELVVNLAAAKSLGLALPTSLVQRADQVIK